MFERNFSFIQYPSGVVNLWVIPDLIIAANALVSNESKLTERIQMADVKCHGLTSSGTSNIKGEPGEMLAKYQADVDST